MTTHTFLRVKRQLATLAFMSVVAGVARHIAHFKTFACAKQSILVAMNVDDIGARRKSVDKKII
jgi:hypothetical protein